MCEYVDHLHEHFKYPVVIKRAFYLPPKDAFGQFYHNRNPETQSYGPISAVAEPSKHIPSAQKVSTICTLGSKKVLATALWPGWFCPDYGSFSLTDLRYQSFTNHLGCRLFNRNVGGICKETSIPRWRSLEETPCCSRFMCSGLILFSEVEMLKILEFYKYRRNIKSNCRSYPLRNS